MSRKSRKRSPASALAPETGERQGKSWARAVVLVILAVALLGAAGLALRRRAVRAVTVHRDPGLSVLLVTIDTLRADALGSYGKANAATPTLDRLAAEGVRFERCHAQNVVTLPSHANILSGRYPLEHGVRDNAGFRFPAGADTLATPGPGGGRALGGGRSRRRARPLPRDRAAAAGHAAVPRPSRLPRARNG